jgi:hypothetical protein
VSTARIVLKFKPENAPARYSEKAGDFFTQQQKTEWEKIVQKFGLLSLEPLFTSQPEDVIRKLEANANVPRERSLTLYFSTILPTTADPGDVVAELLAWSDIDTAYVQPEPTNTTNPGDDPRYLNQGYLQPAPLGIDAVFAWSQPGGDGLGQHFVDVEQGWTFNHEDLAARQIPLINGTISPPTRAHGTSVLGEICASDNKLGGIGIVPSLQTVAASSASGSKVYDAILAAVSYLSNTIARSGVILIEQQWINYNNHPNMIVEADPAVRDVIRLATQLNHLVVEAAGNGSIDLDAYADPKDGAIFRRGDPNYRDSGAVVVGAGSSSLPHAQLSFSNYGSRIDCYGWGENVDTASSNDAGATNLYTNGFNGTSSASPIVAGAALSIQGMQATKSGSVFNPATLREILRDPALGTPASGQIGVMPNLQRIASGVLGLVPDIYVRDFAADNGLPHGGVSSVSPDIIVRRNPVGNPQGAYGEGSGTENNNQLGDPIGHGTDYHAYIRIRNRSSVPAKGVVATLYWAYPSTLVLPSQWNLIGSALVDVPAGNILTVTQGITWPKAQVPPPGHYCFIATVSHQYDQAPNLGAIGTIQNFAAFVQVNNNVAWRNFDVADIRPAGQSETRELPFRLPNPDPGPFVGMKVEFLTDLPPGSRLWLQMPSTIHSNPRYPTSPGTSRGTIKVELRPNGTSEPIESQVLPRYTDMTLQVRIPSKHWPGAGYEVAARQLYRGIEVGRITWLLRLTEDGENETEH